MVKKISLKFVPKAYKNEIIKITENNYKVRLTAAPIDGEANKKLIELLSKFFKVSKTSIQIKKGLKSKNKILEI